ncbi:MAG: hypothetical protein WBG19_05065 [Thermoplasmata archaeon]
MTIRFLWWIRILLLGLVAEFGLGLWLAKYGTFPVTHNVVTTLMYRGDPELSAHIGLAVILVVVAFIVAVSAFGGEAPPRLRWYTLGGFLALLAAYESGIEFILSGFANNDYSYSMLAAFFVSGAFYGLAQWLLRKEAPRAPTQSLAAPSA